MADGFAVDVAEIQKYAQRWNTEAQQIGKLPAQLGTIESRLGAVLENTAATDALSVLVGATQLRTWFDLRSALNDAAGKIDALTRQLAQDSETLRRCSIEYQIADQAAADGFCDVYVFREIQAYTSPIAYLLRSLSDNEARQAMDEAGELIAGSPGSVSKHLTDTGPDFWPGAQAFLDSGLPGGDGENTGNSSSAGAGSGQSDE
jgi:hypothetical protein